MKRKDKKSNKAKEFLKKYQLGGFNADDTLMQNPYEYAPDLQTAQQQQLVQYNQPKNQQAYIPQPQPKPQGFGWDTAIPLISPVINLGIGVKSIIDSFGEKKRQQQYERAYQRDLDRRREEARTDDYYYSPYGVYGTNYGSYEEGGSIPERYKNMGFNRVGQKKESSRDGKKWMVLAKKGDDYKVVHGGYEGMKDFTQHKDEDRRERFWDRMGGKDSAKAKDPFSPLHWHKKFGTWQGGGLYQPNQLDYFIDFYNQNEDQSDISQQVFENYYNQKNQMYEDQWRTKRSSGFQNLLSGATGIAKNFFGGFQQGGLLTDTLMQRSNTNIDSGNLRPDYIKLNPIDLTDQIDQERAEFVWNYKKEHPELFDMLMGRDPEKIRIKPYRSKRFDKWLHEKQEGGTIEKYNPKVDLYSPEYDPNEFLGIQNEIVAAQIEDKESGVIESWLFQDEPELDELNLDYFNPEQTTTTNSYSSGLDVISNIEALESGGNPEAVNPTTNATGLFQFVPKYWAGQIKSYMGLPQTFTQEQVMEAFKKNEKVQRDFMNHVVNDIYMPEVEKLRPLARKYGLDDNKIIKLLHYRGISDAKRRLQTGDFTVSVDEKLKYKNPEILNYLNQ